MSGACHLLPIYLQSSWPTHSKHAISPLCSGVRMGKRNAKHLVKVDWPELRLLDIRWGAFSGDLC